jgi:hypothetical protein
MVSPTLIKIGTYLSDLSKLLFELAQLTLAVAAFGYAALKTQNSTVENFALVLETVGSIYIVFTFSVKTANFGFDISQYSENLFLKIIILVVSNYFVYIITNLVGEISASLINSVVVTLG